MKSLMGPFTLKPPGPLLYSPARPPDQVLSPGVNQTRGTGTSTTTPTRVCRRLWSHATGRRRGPSGPYPPTTCRHTSRGGRRRVSVSAWRPVRPSRDPPGDTFLYSCQLSTVSILSEGWGGRVRYKSQGSVTHLPLVGTVTLTR